MSGAIEHDVARRPLTDRAIRLFKFLGQAQRIKSRPVRTVETYKRDGMVLWFADLPTHQAVRSTHRTGSPEPGEPLLAIDRVPKLAPPAPGALLAKWLAGEWSDPARPPELRDAITVLDETVHQTADAEIVVDAMDIVSSVLVTIDEQPEVRDEFDAWLPQWQMWAEQELRDRPVRNAYGELFSAYIRATGSPEEFELVVGIGCLAWRPPGHDAVLRHLFTAPAAIRFDDTTGWLTVELADSFEALNLELDMLEPGLVKSIKLDEIRGAAQRFEAHPLDRGETKSLAGRLVNILDSAGGYRDADDVSDLSSDAVVSFAPAIILRKRTQQGIVKVLETIAGQLVEDGRVPDGLLPLVDPDHRPQFHDDGHEDGAGVVVDDELFLPLPVNDMQLRIIRSVDRHAQTLVQGPPGTGKTHTAAALLSHLLAQGKRVLVTAHTDRALKEVRQKLPAEIKPLSVAVVGTDREDMSDLKLAVERIAAAAAEHDPDTTAARAAACLDTIDKLRRRRAKLRHELITLRELEVGQAEHSGYKGTLAAIAQQYQDQQGWYGWLSEYVSVPSEAECPLAAREIVEWRNYLAETALVADEPESAMCLVNLTAMPEPPAFARLVHTERTAAGASGPEVLRTHPTYETLRWLDDPERQQLRQRLLLAAQITDDLAKRPEQWMSEALTDVLSGRGSIWESRARQVSDLVDSIGALIDKIGDTTMIEVAAEDVGQLAAQANALLTHVNKSGPLKTTPSGAPKISAFAPSILKQVRPFFEQVRVNGVPPTTSEHLTAFITWVEATRQLAALDRAWPESVIIPREDTRRERLQWHITELEQLIRVVDLGQTVRAEDQRLADLGLPSPRWQDPEVVRTFARVADLVSAAEPLARIEATVADAAHQPDAAPATRELHVACVERDPDGYARAYQRLARLQTVCAAVARRDSLGGRLRAAAPGLAEAIATAAEDPAWDSRLAAFDRAWVWASTGSWLRERKAADVNAVQSEIADIEEHIRREVETLAATRAWGHAVDPGRISGTARADLRLYADLVKRLGKGQGKYAGKRQADIREALDRCRPAVPVWIMPIYRISEQLRIRPHMFDVVIIDEASQAGLEAIFLQYLAPRIVVIGDDKQVSPAAVGVDQQQLRDLAMQYLADDRYRVAWQEPQRSLFDEAKMRYGEVLTLTEHRRCVPEIIGFSNRVAYEPDGIRLIPVRQYGADRLEPVKPVFLSDGYTRGNNSKTNPVEVDAIVDQIEKCIADPRYDGLTFGVISLLGKAQAKMIEKRLLERISPLDWANRDLRCGDSADFQGSERDVMFLSMVTALEPDQRLAALTQSMYMQRYNVAASRAKDQMWLFHSIRPADIVNPEDMRFQLLDYCYGVVRQGLMADEGGVRALVPDDRRVDPFDSLFEQRVYNRITDRGYTVIPQYPALGYKIDLVVVGAHARMAIECDGDTWHGPEAYGRDLARQRELERCGWRFFRIRESAFYIDQAGVLRDLWTALRSMGIHPSDWTSAGADEPNDRDSACGEPLNLDALLDEAEDPHTMPGIVETPADVDIVEHLDGHEARSIAAVDAGLNVAAPPVTTPDPPVSITEHRRQKAQSKVADAQVGSEVAVVQVRRSTTSFAAYEVFNGAVPHALEASRRELITGIHAILAVEGPMLGHRLHSIYLRASGQRPTKQIASALNSAISSAVHQRILVEDAPLAEVGVKPRTYRLPGQPEARIRLLGPRSLDEVPPRELALLLSEAAELHGRTEIGHEALFRAAAHMIGLDQLTPGVFARFEQVFPLMPGA